MIRKFEILSKEDFLDIANNLHSTKVRYRIDGREGEVYFLPELAEDDEFIQTFLNQNLLKG